MRNSVIVYSVCFTVLVLITSQTPLAYGHGLGSDETAPVAIGEGLVSLEVQMVPSSTIKSVDSGTIKIRLKDPRNGETIPHTTFAVTIDKESKTLLSEQFHAHDGHLYLAVRPVDTDSVEISASKEQLGWVGSRDSPAEVEAPIYLDGGLYHYSVQVLTLESDQNVLDPVLSFDAYVTIGEEARHTINLDDESYDISTRTYFDEIYDFTFDDNTIRFTMPLDWSRKFLEQVPLVHIEVIVPKSASELMTSDYTATLNGVELPRNAIIIDDSNPDRRIVHYMVTGDRLAGIAKEAGTKPGQGTAVFTLQPSTVPRFPLETLTNGEKFGVHLSWDPAVIEPGSKVNFIFNIQDPAIGDTVTNAYYEFVLVKDGKEIYRNSKIASIGAEVEQFTFTEEHAGNIVVRFENINHTGEFTEYLLTVVPEFPPGMLLTVFAVAAFAFAVAGNKYRKQFAW